jgi:FtsP/CotA-like multicopper oxidase with cupredoxin domain
MRRPLARPAIATAAALMAVTALAACGSDDDSGDAAAPTTSTSVAPEAGETAATDSDRTVIEVSMVGGKVTPAPDTVDVREGDKVRIIVTRDTDGTVHVHGLEDELDVDVKAGVPTNLDFVADQQGSYEVEAHDPDRALLTVQVR